MATETARPRVVVGIDGSDTSREALEWAVAHARLIDGEVEAVMAWEPSRAILLTPTRTEEDDERDAERLIDHVLGQVLPHIRDVEVHRSVVLMRPALALTEAAVGAELLVVGGRGHGALAGMHLGSVASYCAHHAPCPVLVYRPKADVTEAPA